MKCFLQLLINYLKLCVWGLNMKNIPLLIKREYWENKILWIAPIFLTVLFTAALLSLAESVFDFSFTELLSVNISEANGIQTIKSVNEDVKFSAIINLQITDFLKFSSCYILLCTTALMTLITFFYSLYSIYGDRKDGSIMFWKSLPISHTEYVLSKLLVSIFTIASSFFVALIVTMSVYYLKIGTGFPFFDSILILLKSITVALVTLYTLISFCLFVSSFSSKNPFFIGFLLPIISYVILEILHIAWPVRKLISLIFAPIEKMSTILLEHFLVRDGGDVLSLSQDTISPFYEIFSSVEFWGYFILGTFFVFATIWRQRKGINLV